VLLPDEFIERSRAHAVGQGARAQGARIFRRNGLEKVHKITRSFHHRGTEKSS
jgi:hypothetical protein